MLEHRCPGLLRRRICRQRLELRQSFAKPSAIAGHGYRSCHHGIPKWCCCEGRGGSCHQPRPLRSVDIVNSSQAETADTGLEASEENQLLHWMDAHCLPPGGSSSWHAGPRPSDLPRRFAQQGRRTPQRRR